MQRSAFESKSPQRRSKAFFPANAGGKNGWVDPNVLGSAHEKFGIWALRDEMLELQKNLD